LINHFGEYNIQSLLSDSLPISLAIIMFSLGIGLTFGDFARIFKIPVPIFIGVLCQIFVIPITAFLMVLILNPPPEIALGVMILSFCPGGVMSNMMTKFAGGSVALSISLTGAVSLLSVVTVPLLVSLAALYFLKEGSITVDASNLGLSVFAITALPAGLGILARRYAENTIIRLEPWIIRLASVLFLIIVIGSVAFNWDLFVEHFSTIAPMMIGLNIILLMIGLMIARIFKQNIINQITISIETGVQNSALGITIGSLIVESSSGVPVFSLPSGVYGITTYFILLPFIIWARIQSSRYNR